MNLKKSILFIFICLSQVAQSQEGLAVYSDYLSDNLYLLHPSMAGAANCGKVRLTGRQQWFGQENAPALQTLSFNNSLSDQSGIGAIVFNDRNGYHSQAGVKLTYAHHLRFSRSTVDLNQLSFGINAAFIQSKLDGTRFTGFDPSIVPGVIQKDAYFNVDLGVSYYLRDFFTHFTVNNFLETRREIYAEDYESDNVRKYIWSVGGVLGNSDRIMWEPSFMFQYTEETTEKTLDLNMKAYKNMDFGRLWAGVSYRTAFDATQYNAGSGLSNQTLQYITPIVGINYEKYMFAYTYSKIIGDVQFDTGGFHQLTLGIDIFCKDKLYDCNCPAVN